MFKDFQWNCFNLVYTCNIALILFFKCDVTKFRIPPPLVTQCHTSSNPPLTCDVIYGWLRIYRKLANYFLFIPSLFLYGNHMDTCSGNLSEPSVVLDDIKIRLENILLTCFILLTLLPDKYLGLESPYGPILFLIRSFRGSSFS